MDQTNKQLQAYEPPAQMSFKRSDIAKMSPTEYKKHRQAILEAAKAGNITDDMQQPLGAPPVTVFYSGQDEPLEVESMPDTMGRL